MKGKIYDIEALRCFSIIAVILQHIDHLFPYPIPIIGKIHNKVKRLDQTPYRFSA